MQCIRCVTRDTNSMHDNSRIREKVDQNYTAFSYICYMYIFTINHFFVNKILKYSNRLLKYKSSKTF